MFGAEIVGQSRNILRQSNGNPEPLAAEEIFIVIESVNLVVSKERICPVDGNVRCLRKKTRCLRNIWQSVERTGNIPALYRQGLNFAGRKFRRHLGIHRVNGGGTGRNRDFIQFLLLPVKNQYHHTGVSV